MDKIRVVYLIGQLGMGGSERQLYLLLKHRDRSRLDAFVVVFNPSPNETYQAALEEAGIAVAQIPAHLRGLIRRSFWLFRFFRRIRPHVAHSWTVHDNPYAGIVGAAAGVPVRWGSQRGSLTLHSFSSLSIPFQALCLRSVSKLVVNSNAIRHELLAKGHSQDRIIHLPNCVEIHENSGPCADFSRLGIEAGHRLVGTVGNIRAVKNHAMFVNAMARVLRTFPAMRAVLVGHPIGDSPDLLETLRAEIHRLGMTDKIILTGFFPDVASVMRRLSVFCLTSDSEGLPNVVLEAMAEGVPVVATRVGGVPELIDDGETGFLVEPGDANTMAARVEDLLTDAALADRMGRAGRDRAVKHLGCDETIGHLFGLYEDAVSRRQRAG